MVWKYPPQKHIFRGERKALWTTGIVLSSSRYVLYFYFHLHKTKTRFRFLQLQELITSKKTHLEAQKQLTEKNTYFKSIKPKSIKNNPNETHL